MSGSLVFTASAPKPTALYEFKDQNTVLLQLRAQRYQLLIPLHRRSPAVSYRDQNFYVLIGSLLIGISCKRLPKDATIPFSSSIFDCRDEEGST